MVLIDNRQLFKPIFFQPIDGPVDPFASELPDIDAENDMKEMKERDKQIDQDVNQIGEGVKRLRDIAIDMGQVRLLTIDLMSVGIGKARC